MRFYMAQRGAEIKFYFVVIVKDVVLNEVLGLIH
jgi:uncharacterized membrane protein